MSPLSAVSFSLLSGLSLLPLLPESQGKFPFETSKMRRIFFSLF